MERKNESASVPSSQPALAAADAVAPPRAYQPLPQRLQLCNTISAAHPCATGAPQAQWAAPSASTKVAVAASAVQGGKQPDAVSACVKGY